MYFVLNRSQSAHAKKFEKKEEGKDKTLSCICFSCFRAITNFFSLFSRHLFNFRKVMKKKLNVTSRVRICTLGRIGRLQIVQNLRLRKEKTKKLNKLAEMPRLVPQNFAETPLLVLRHFTGRFKQELQ